LFSKLGGILFEENLKHLEKEGVWVQLNPKDVLQIMGINNQENISSYTVENKIILEQFRQIDTNLAKSSLSKITSSIFLAIFGWAWNNPNELRCNFCATSCDVRSFLSPS
jgi:hypothetical protein